MRRRRTRKLKRNAARALLNERKARPRNPTDIADTVEQLLRPVRRVRRHRQAGRRVHVWAYATATENSDVHPVMAWGVKRKDAVGSVEDKTRAVQRRARHTGRHIRQVNRSGAVFKIRHQSGEVGLVEPQLLGANKRRKQLSVNVQAAHRSGGRARARSKQDTPELVVISFEAPRPRVGI